MILVVGATPDGVVMMRPAVGAVPEIDRLGRPKLDQPLKYWPELIPPFRRCQACIPQAARVSYCCT
jgi:hypothetical protein